MIALRDLREFVWPMLDALSEEEVERRRERRDGDIGRIKAMRLERDAGVALEEARRMADSETQRSRGTDQKAATYLPLVAALVPLILTLVSAHWEKKPTGAPTWLNTAVLGVAVAYVAAAGVWAFRVLEVQVSHELGPRDLDAVWSRRRPSAALTRRLLVYVKLNQAGIDRKVSRIDMAHRFLLRAFLVFSFLLLVNIACFFGAWIWNLLPSGRREVLTPRRAIVMTMASERMSGRLRTTTAWIVLDQTCRRRTRGRTGLMVAAGFPDPVDRAPAEMRLGVGERAVTRTFDMRCAGSRLGAGRVVYVPGRFGAQPRPSIALLARAMEGARVTASRQVWPRGGPASKDEVVPSVVARQWTSLHGSDGRPAGLSVVVLTVDAVTS